ncbi:MAG: hypothetical protein C4560_08075 [Nitrospiraceae bacterium]|nr:MAG: hypothetical protein C4560_08075 [Nitrospiraceae bacterium]
MEILKGVIKKSVFIAVPAAALSALIEARGLPLGILLGCLFGILNLRALIKNVKGLVGPEQAAAKVVISSFIRLSALVAAIFMLLYYNIVNIFGLLIGFTVVFAAILIEGWRTGKAKSS